MKQPQLPIYKAIYRGPITPFVTIGSGHLVPKCFRKPNWLAFGLSSHTKAAALQDLSKIAKSCRQPLLWRLTAKTLQKPLGLSHSVPHVKSWHALLNQFGDHLDAWEKLAMEAEIRLFQQGVQPEELFRRNNTLRWFNSHEMTCSFSLPTKQPAATSGTSSSSTVKLVPAAAVAPVSSLSTMATKVTSLGTLPGGKPGPRGINADCATETKRSRLCNNRLMMRPFGGCWVVPMI